MEVQKREPCVLMRISAWTFTIIGAGLPAFGFFTCIILSVVLNFEASTLTHCAKYGANNYLPSISAAIGGFTPQRYIWRMCIALSLFFQSVSVIWNYNYYKTAVVKWQALFNLAVKLRLILHIVEKCGLIGLTYISSTENYPAHEMCFIIFMACALSHMFLSCVVIRWSEDWKPLTGRNLKCYTTKLYSFLFNGFTFAVAVYCFVRHNNYCETGMYSLFALFEYFVVLSNIFFHMVDGFIQFADYDLTFAPRKHHGS